MAIVTRRLASLHDGKVFLDVTYDDAGAQINQVTAVEYQGHPDRRRTIVRADEGGRNVVDAEETRGEKVTLTRNAGSRFNWQTMSFNVSA